MATSGLGRSRRSDSIAHWFDSFFFLLLVVSAFIGFAYIAEKYFTPSIKLFAVDWGTVWEALEEIGLTAVIGRGAYAMWKRFRGDEKYYQAILMVLDDAPYPISKEKVKKRVESNIGMPIILNPVPLLFKQTKERRRADLFGWKFNTVWINMREAGIIGRTVEEGMKLYFLNETAVKEKI